MAGITTHVLDTARGRPIAGIRVTLRLGARIVFDGRTDADGRARMAERAERGTYELAFETGEVEPGGFYPVVTITFHAEDPAQHYHVPLLLSPFGYSTYRGS